jgi:hypothetical protein
LVPLQEVVRELIPHYAACLDLHYALVDLVVPTPEGGQPAGLVGCRHEDGHALVAFRSALPPGEDALRLANLAEAALRRSHRSRGQEALAIWVTDDADFAAVSLSVMDGASRIYRVAEVEAHQNPRVREMDREVERLRLAIGSDTGSAAMDAAFDRYREAEQARDAVVIPLERRSRERQLRLSPRLLGM